MKVNSERERLLCYASAIMSAKLSNPGNIYTPQGLMGHCIRTANMMIETIYDDVKLAEILAEKDNVY